MKNIIINKIKIDKLKPLRKNLISRNKKLSATGYYKNIKVKVYGVHDTNQGKLRRFVAKNKDLSKYFPKLITFDSRFIVEEWVEGRTLKELNLKNSELKAKSVEIKKIINIMWSIKLDYSVFDYIDHIHKRVKKKNHLDLSNIPIRLNHNDLSLDNIILSAKGLKIIDNEFLGCNNGWILNIKNSFLIEDFDYQNFVSKKTLNQLWNLRREWSNLITKKNKRSNQPLNFLKKLLLKFMQK
jgi:predicted Ser/Thr protein kinase